MGAATNKVKLYNKLKNKIMIKKYRIKTGFYHKFRKYKKDDISEFTEKEKMKLGNVIQEIEENTAEENTAEKKETSKTEKKTREIKTNKQKLKNK